MHQLKRWHLVLALTLILTVGFWQLQLFIFHSTHARGNGHLRDVGRLGGFYDHVAPPTTVAPAVYSGPAIC